MDKIYMVTPKCEKYVSIEGRKLLELRVHLKRCDIWYCRQEVVVTVYSGVTELLFDNMDEVLKYFDIVGEICNEKTH